MNRGSTVILFTLALVAGEQKTCLTLDEVRRYAAVISPHRYFNVTFLLRGRIENPHGIPMRRFRALPVQLVFHNWTIMRRGLRSALWLRY